MTQRPLAEPAPHVAPEAGPGPAVARRLTSVRYYVLKLHENYLTGEAPTRAAKFEQLAGAVDQLARMDGPVTELEVLELLGPPDYADSDERGAEFVYLYDRFATKDWAAFVTIGPEGLLRQVGWNASSANDLSQFRKYVPWGRPAPPAKLPLLGGYLGVDAREFTWDEGGHNYIGFHGVLIASVVPDSPADKAGIVAGDIIEAIDGQRADATDFSQKVDAIRPGRSVKIALRRWNGSAQRKQQTIEATIGTRPRGDGPP